MALREGAGSDQAVIDAVDIQPLKHTPRFPYILVVRKGEIFALHPRFTLPLDFPDWSGPGGTVLQVDQGARGDRRIPAFTVE